MAGSVNKAIVVGNLGRDPETRHTQGGQTVCNFSVATSEKWRDKGGESQESTEWHRIVCWGKLAELCDQYLSKGRSVYVEGKIQTREWTDKQGEKRYTTEIVAKEVQFLDKGDRSDSRGDSRGDTRSRDDYGPGVGYEDDQPGGDVPF